MGSGEFGGDSSVEWKVVAGNVRRSAVRTCTIGDTGFEQGGVDETDDGELFTVTIKVPRDPAEFVRSLRAAADDAARHSGEPGYPVSFVLPIEPKTPGQVQIVWKSMPVVSVDPKTRGPVGPKKPAAKRRR